MARKSVIVILILLSLAAPVSAWWDSDYLYRQEITITDPPAVSDFQAPFTITYNAHMDADFADVRFVDNDDTTELDYWIEDYTASTSATGYVELADTGNTIYLYYGNDEVSSASNGAATFLDYLDGSAGDLDRFNTGGKTNGQAVLDAECLKIYQNPSSTHWGAYAATKNLYSKTSNYTIEFDYKKPTQYSSGARLLAIFAVENSTTCARDTTYYYVPKYQAGGNWDNYLYPSFLYLTTTVADWTAGRIDINGTSGYYRFNLGSWVSITNWNQIDSTYDLEFFRADYSNKEGYYDNIIVRKYAATEPSFAYGEEEAGTIPPVAAFSGDPLSGYGPLTVTFTDASTNTPTSWCWDIDNDGDCDYATQNCSHTYTSQGLYTVNLTVSNGDGSDSEVKSNYINVTAVLSPFPGYSNSPTDLNADDLYEDINGNGRWDYNDIIVYFQNLAWCEANQPIALFDWNSNSRCDYDDVYELWQEGGIP